jgi:hypothetical protein
MDLLAHLFPVGFLPTQFEYVKNPTEKICTKISHLLTRRKL